MKKAAISDRAALRKGTTTSRKPRTRIPAKVTEKEETDRGYQIRSIYKAFDLLEALCEDDATDAAGTEEVRITRLSKRLRTSKATVFRLLATFEKRGYVEREESGVYRIGMNAYEVACKLRSRMNLLNQARPAMEDLCRRCNETVYLAVQRGGDFLLIDLVESAQQVKVTSFLGRRFSLANGAPGQLISAFANGSNLASAAADPALQSIQQQGYCSDRGGLGEAIDCVAAPIFRSGGSMVGALCVVVPSFRMPGPEREKALIADLKYAADAISARLGHHVYHTGRVRL